MPNVANKCRGLIVPTEAIEIKLNENLSLHTSFKIGGLCDTFVIPKTEAGIKAVLQFATLNNLPLVVIGNGTNILFQDAGFAGIVIRIADPCFCNVKLHETRSPNSAHQEPIYMGAGISVPRLLNLMVEYGLAGLEFMAGIPGTLGGAIVMNAGTKGRGISECIQRVKVMSRSGEVYWVDNQEAGFGYRESRFKKSGEIVLEAELNLKKGNPTEISAQIQELISERQTKLPLDLPSAGCVFKNPVDISAAKLVELAGCKGMRIGDAQVSDKHANFIVNLGFATHEDIKTLIKEIQARVYKKFKIALELELIIL